jgi:hypothetical protein
MTSIAGAAVVYLITAEPAPAPQPPAPEPHGEIADERVPAITGAPSGELGSGPTG